VADRRPVALPDPRGTAQKVWLPRVDTIRQAQNPRPEFRPALWGEARPEGQTSPQGLRKPHVQRAQNGDGVPRICRRQHVEVPRELRRQWGPTRAHALRLDPDGDLTATLQFAKSD